jgi:hydroxymethylglutaryl-CoA lyase
MQRILIREVGLRDGLQLVKSFLPTERKLEWCRKAVEAGVTEIEVTSFVPPSVVPQFADAGAVVEGAKRIDGLTVTCLVPNLKGAVRAFDAKADKINYVVSASEAHNLSNVRRSTQESLDDFARIAEERKRRASGTKIVGCAATAFGCSIQGAVAESRVIEMIQFLASAGADEIVIADTVGYGNPVQVERIFSAARAIFAGPIYAHFHDTRGLGLANVAAAVKVGIAHFDASLGGLGGCPFAPGASGNIDTEDCVYLLESMGFETGLDIGKLVALRNTVAGWLPGEAFGGAIARAGLPKTFSANRNTSLTE